MPVPAIKTLKARAGDIDLEAERYPGIDLLADTDVPGLPGGTGQGYDVALLASLTARRRVIVAGGLHPGNVAEVVARPARFVYVSKAPFGQNLAYDAHAVYTTTKLRRELGLVPSYTLASGLAQTFAWYRREGLDRRDVDFREEDALLAGH